MFFCLMMDVFSSVVALVINVMSTFLQLPPIMANAFSYIPFCESHGTRKNRRQDNCCSSEGFLQHGRYLMWWSSWLSD